MIGRMAGLLPPGVRVPCPVSPCPDSFSSSWALGRHLARQHPEAVPDLLTRLKPKTKEPR
jgi:hypothetical protein